MPIPSARVVAAATEAEAVPAPEPLPAAAAPPAAAPIAARLPSVSPRRVPATPDGTPEPTSHGEPDKAPPAAPSEALPLPAGQKVELKPGSTHVMLMGLRDPLVDGGVASFTLTFEKAPAIGVHAAVKQPPVVDSEE